MKRRSFFTAIAKASAIVALAPQLAFRVKPDLPVVDPEPVKYVWSMDWTNVNLDTGETTSGYSVF